MYVHDRIDLNERFRERRRQARRRRRARRSLAAAILLGCAAALAAGAAFFTSHGGGGLGAVDGSKLAPLPKPRFRALPAEVRGVHVTMALASVRGKLDEYYSLQSWGLNTIELDVKDESGEVAFASPSAPLATEVDAVRSYYDPRQVVRKARARGLYLIGRVVTFEDPVLSERRPDLAIKNPDGSVWRNDVGLGWTNPYDKRVWDYNVDIAVGAARAGFDEIQFDYVRFPSDGDTDSIVYPGKGAEPKAETIYRFLRYATKRLRPLGVRVSADVFGLAATQELGIGQSPRKLARILDAVYPMVYPSHYGPGEYQLDDPNAVPGQTVAFSLADFQRQMRGKRAKLIPWLQDFSLGREYTLADVQDQVAAARRMNARGFLLWNAAGVYRPEALMPGS